MQSHSVINLLTFVVHGLLSNVSKRFVEHNTWEVISLFLAARCQRRFSRSMLEKSTNDTERQAVALVRYQTQYNNETYQAVQTAVIGNLYGKAFAVDAATRETLLHKEVPNLLMNLLTD